ncbi:MAG TPA: hypothetical protein VJH55_04205 [Candidatus Paceibacterota bacterium]
MTAAIKNTIDTFARKENVIVYALLFCLLSLGALYGFLVQGAIVNVVLREDAQKVISTMTSELGALETKYIATKNTVTLELAREKGFVDAESTTFITKTILGKNTVRGALE